MNSQCATEDRTPGPATRFFTKPGQRPTIMVLHAEDGEIAELFGILGRCGYNVEWWTTLSDGLAGLRTIAPPIVMCESNLPDGSWKDLLHRIRSFEPAPLEIVTDRSADERLWGDVLSAGAYDLLMEPFDAGEVIRSLSFAIQYWHETQMVRRGFGWSRSHARRSA
jgi:DNA-binding response OmpR family regulator